MESGGSVWEVATRVPAPALTPYVRDFMGYDERCAAPCVRREFPAPQVVVILELGPSIVVFDRDDPRRASRYPGGFVAGVDDGFTLTEHHGFQRGIQVNLTPIGARLCFGVPMSELAPRVVSLRDLLPTEHAHLAEQLEELDDWSARFDLLERVLAARIARARIDTRVVLHACRRIEARACAIDMRALARELGYSQKHVITLFRDQVGVAPKLLSRLTRFDRLMQRLKNAPGESPCTWATLAAELGYYDQAHLARDVKQFTGVTPTKARAMLIDFTEALT